MNKFLSQIEKMAATTGEVLRGAVSPAWQEHHIAAKHGKEGPKGVGANVKKHVTGTLRAAGRSVVESAAGSGLGYGAGKLIEVASKGKLKAAPLTGALVGSYTGAYHGALRSSANQANEAHRKYSAHEKKACLDLLLQNGFDFDSAVAAIEKEAGVINGLKGMSSMVGGKAKTFATAVKTDAPKLGAQMKTMATGKATLKGTRFTTNVGVSRGQAFKELAANRAAQAGAAGAVVGSAMGSAMGSKKKKDD